MKLRVEGRGAPDPLPEPPPDRRPGARVVASLPAPPPSRKVFVARAAYEAMLAHAREGGELEVGGFLLGGRRIFDGAEYLDVTHAVAAVCASSARAQVSFTNEAQRAFHEEKEARFPDEVVLGWYHTHPGYGLFLSSHDQFIQRSFFREPWHVAVVIDPFADGSRRAAVFAWEEEERVSGARALLVYGEGDGAAGPEPLDRGATGAAAGGE